jgi:hypothetical protein
MNSKERVLTTFKHSEPDRVPYWCGASPEFMRKAQQGLSLSSEEEVRVLFGDDFRRVIASYVHKSTCSKNKTPFGILWEGIGYGLAVNHPLSNAIVKEVDNYGWPDPKNVDISFYRSKAQKYWDDYAVLGGDWSYWEKLILTMFWLCLR